MLWEHQSSVYRWMPLRLSGMVQSFLDAWPLSPLLRLILGVMKHARSPDLLAFYLAHAADVRELLATHHGRIGLFLSIDYTHRVHPDLDRDTLIRHLAPLVGPGIEDHMLTFEQLLRKEEFEEGVEKGQRELLLEQFTERFGALPRAVTERITRASAQNLKRWGKRILTAASLDDVFASS